MKKSRLIALILSCVLLFSAAGCRAQRKNSENPAATDTSATEDKHGDESANNSIKARPLTLTQTVSLGDEHSAAITTDGSLYTWGNNSHGLLGNGPTEGSNIYSNIPMKIMDNVATVSLGTVHSAAITTDGGLYTWGSNDAGQLGNGTTEDSNFPIKIMDNVAAVSLGSSHSAAITTDGSLYTWGFNNEGQLGNGTRNNKHTPVKIMDNVVAVSLGNYHSAAITTDGSLYTWGSNIAGQLGNGTNGITEDSKVPIKIMDNVKLPE